MERQDLDTERDWWAAEQLEVARELARGEAELEAVQMARRVIEAAIIRARCPEDALEARLKVALRPLWKRAKAARG